MFGYHIGKEKESGKSTLVIIVFLAIIISVVSWSLLKKKNTIKEKVPVSQKRDRELTERERIDLYLRLSKGIVSVKAKEDKNRIEPLPIESSGFYLNDAGVLVIPTEMNWKRQGVAIISNAKEEDKRDTIADDFDRGVSLVSIKNSLISRNMGLDLTLELPKAGEEYFFFKSGDRDRFEIQKGRVKEVRDFYHMGDILILEELITERQVGMPIFNGKGEIFGTADYNYWEGEKLSFAVPLPESFVKFQWDSQNESGRSYFHGTAGHPRESTYFMQSDDPFAKGLLLYEYGEFAEALPYFRMVKNEESIQHLIHFYLGACSVDTDISVAREELRIALEKNPEFIKGYIYLGYVYFRMNDMEQAILAWEEADKRAPDYPNLVFWLNDAYVSRNRILSSIFLLEKNFLREPNAHIAQLLTHTYLRDGELEKATHFANQLRLLNQGEIDAYEVLTRIAVCKKKWSEGIRFAGEGLVYDDDNADLLFLQGICFLGNKEKEEAKKNLSLLYRAHSMKNDRNRLENSLRYIINRFTNSGMLDWLEVEDALKKFRLSV